jgi:amidase
MAGIADETRWLDATAQAALVESGELRPSELVAAAVERATKLNPALNAIIHEFYAEAIEGADDAPAGPFRGVPFLFKDLGAALAGQPMFMGMQFLKDLDFRSPVDTYLGSRLRDAGLVTIGKTNTPELGILPTTEPLAYGATANPWNLDHTPGGSSGGSAAAVAAGIVPVAHANDGGGSIRIPASCCGLVGLKPSRARTSQGPLAGDTMSGLVEELVVARSVRDVAGILDAVHGMGPGDPYTAPPPSRPYMDELTADHEGLRIGLASTPYIDLEPDPEVQVAARAAARMLTDLGHEVDEQTPEAPAASSGLPDPAQTFMARWYVGQTLTFQQLEMVTGRSIGADDVEPLTWEMAQRGKAVTGSEYLGAVTLHQAIGRMLGDWFDSGHDLMLTPTLAETPPRLGDFPTTGADPFEAMRRAQSMGAFTALINSTGNPAISLPLHMSDGGLPVGVQLIAPYGREDLLLRVAAQLEAAHPWSERRPDAVDAERQD